MLAKKCRMNCAKGRVSKIIHRIDLWATKAIFLQIFITIMGLRRVLLVMLVNPKDWHMNIGFLLIFVTVWNMLDLIKIFMGKVLDGNGLRTEHAY